MPTEIHFISALMDRQNMNCTNKTSPQNAGIPKGTERINDDGTLPFRLKTLQSHGKQLISESLSPSGKDLLQRALSFDENEAEDKLENTRRVERPSSLNHQETVNMITVACPSRPLCINLELDREYGNVVVSGFSPHPRSGKGHLEASGRIRVGDILEEVNDDYIPPDLDRARQILYAAQLPMTLVFRRRRQLKNTLGEYNRQDIISALEQYDSPLLLEHSPETAAAMISALMEMYDASTSTTTLQDFLTKCSLLLVPLDPDNINRFNSLKDHISSFHTLISNKALDKVKKWESAKNLSIKKIHALEKQKKKIAKDLEQSTITITKHGKDSEQWQNHIQLRDLLHCLAIDLEQSKQAYYFPECEGYRLRLGSDGVYVGCKEMWISSFSSSYSIQSQPQFPHVLLKLGGIDSNSGAHLKFKASNFRVVSEGRVPGFRFGELNVETELFLTIPLIWDRSKGWEVLPNDLQVKLKKFVYSGSKGSEHDVIMKLFVSRLLPGIVRFAATTLLPSEFGTSIAQGHCQIFADGELNITGMDIAVMDGSLCDSEASQRSVGINCDQAQVLLTLYRGFVDPQCTELNIKTWMDYTDKYGSLTNDKPTWLVLATLWQQAIDIFQPKGLKRLVFQDMISKVQQIRRFPVDISLAVHDVRIKINVDGCVQAIHLAVRRASTSSSALDESDLAVQARKIDDIYNSMRGLLDIVKQNVDIAEAFLSLRLPAGIDSTCNVEVKKLFYKGAVNSTMKITDTISHPSKYSMEIIASEPNKLTVRKFIANTSQGITNESTNCGSDYWAMTLEKALMSIVVDHDHNLEVNQVNGYPLCSMSLNSGPSNSKISFCSGAYTKCIIEAAAIYSSFILSDFFRFDEGSSSCWRKYLESRFFAISFKMGIKLQHDGVDGSLSCSIHQVTNSSATVLYMTSRCSLMEVLEDLGHLSFIDEMGRVCRLVASFGNEEAAPEEAQEVKFSADLRTTEKIRTTEKTVESRQEGSIEQQLYF